MSQKLFNMVIVGLGGVGNVIASNIFAFTRGVISGWRLNKLLFIDGDSYSKSNIPRQQAAGAMLGHNKAEAWAGIYGRSKWNLLDTRVSYKPEWVTNDTVSRLLSEHIERDCPCVVFTCVDNHPARLVMSKWLAGIMAEQPATSVVVIQGGSRTNYATADLHGRWMDDETGELVTVGRPIEEGHPEILETDEGDRSRMSCEELALSPTGDQSYPDNFLAGSMMLNLLFTLLCPTGASVLSKYIGETAEITMHYHQIDKNLPKDEPEEVGEDSPGDPPGSEGVTEDV